MIDTEFPIEDKFAHLPASAPDAVARRGVSAFVTVQEGCDKFCSFCVVPYTRGAEASRPVAAILAEIGRLARAGVREVMLLGQNVNAYHGADAAGRPVGLAGLIAAAAAVPGVARVRYMTSHPNDMKDDLIAAHREIEALAPYLHLPVQSGSDRILASMNRRHRAADYLAVIARVREARPDIALSSDFIVGYPGETDADFEATLDLVRAVGFASSYAFKYSARPGTPAAEMDGQVPDGVKVGASGGAPGAARGAAAGVQPGLRREAPRGPVREARAARRAGDRPFALYAGGVRRGSALADRRDRRGRDRRPKAEFVAGTPCLANVAKTGFDLKCRMIRAENRNSGRAWI